MDPLTIISLAGNIIQFVSFGTSILSDATELYKSTNGVLSTNETLELATRDLRAVIMMFRQHVSISHLGTSAQSRQVLEDSLGRICDSAATVADDLLRQLEKLKMKGRRKAWKSFREAIRAAWTKEEIEALCRQLSDFQTDLETQVLLSLSIKLDQVLLHHSKRFDELDSQNQTIIAALAVLSDVSKMPDASEHDLEEQMGALAQLVARLEAATHDQEITVKGFKATTEHETMHCRRVQEKILQGLRFPGMTDRYEQVSAAYERTFAWIFSHPAQDQVPWSNFASWLEQGSGVYWINGKAGSGKSTLMKHIFNNPSTQLALKSWAGTNPLCSSTFFFWNSGTPEQKSQSGLLAALLHDILNQCPALIPVILSLDWSRVYSALLGTGISPFLGLYPNLETLRSAFQALGQQTAVPVKICLFVDGLDEFDGDHEQLADLFINLAKLPNVKVCVTSRPWVVFQDLFQSCPSLRLQDSTYGDIQHYVSHKMHKNSAFKRLFEKDPNSAGALIEEVVEKAKGVFLWVEIVVKSLLNGIRNRDEPKDLRARLRLLPRELEPLYEHLLGLIEPVYLEWASKSFQLVRSARIYQEYLCQEGGERRQPFNLLDLYLSIKEDIDIKDLPDYKSDELQIRYLHRTARDFVEKPDVWKRILSYTTDTSFNPAAYLLVGSVRLLALKSSYVSSCPQMDEFWDSIACALVYAYHANIETQDPRVEVHDQLGIFLTKTLGYSEKVKHRWAGHYNRVKLHATGRFRGEHARSGVGMEEVNNSNGSDDENQANDASGEEESEGESDANRSIEQAENRDCDDDEHEHESFDERKSYIKYPHLMDRYSVLPWAVVYDLTAYVSAKIQTTHQPASLLHYLNTEQKEVYFESLVPGDNPDLRPPPSAKMACILVRNGGDPNRRYFEDKSPWERALLCAIGFTPGEAKTAIARRSYISVILALIRGGADLKASVCWDGLNISATKIIDRAYLSDFPREFPVESEKLFREITKKRRYCKGSPDRYRPPRASGQNAKRFRGSS
ncbi:hypothetical protein N431DRAFT_471808 [Stipitochalara longipes BDJ]|nr:hypothetical protein N431DRAFT_471808 [Stipitochalara longipes BDJ]